MLRVGLEPNCILGCVSDLCIDRHLILKPPMKKYHSNIIAGILIFITLFINLAESLYGTSLRYIFTSIFVYYLATSLIINGFTLTKNSLGYIFFIALYVFSFYMFGSGNNLIIHLLTICIGVALFYNSLLALNYDVIKIWKFVKIIWCVIYLTLAIELIFVILGYQDLLSDTFPEFKRTLGFPAYRSLDNTFASFFEFNFKGLNSITLQAQAYGQFCVMLTILGFTYTENRYRISNLIRLLIFIVVPLIMYSISPNITAIVIFIFIVSYFLFIKSYLKIYSFVKLLSLSIILIILVLFYLLGDFGFVRKYQFHDIYDLFLSHQFDYFLTMTFSDYILGVNLENYYNVAPKFEISYLSYLSVSGLIFGLLNLIILFKFTHSTLKQIKYFYKTKPFYKKLIEIQSANLLFVLSMLVSSIHFPVITNYLGTLIFIFHLSFGFYILKINRAMLVKCYSRVSEQACPFAAQAFAEAPQEFRSC